MPCLGSLSVLSDPFVGDVKGWFRFSVQWTGFEIMQPLLLNFLLIC